MIIKTAERIRDLRENRGITQAALGRYLGVSRSSVNYWEMGVSSPSVDKLCDLARFFHTTTDYVLGIDDRELIDISYLAYDEKELLSRMMSYFDKMNHPEKTAE